MSLAKKHAKQGGFGTKLGRRLTKSIKRRGRKEKRNRKSLD